MLRLLATGSGCLRRLGCVLLIAVCNFLTLRSNLRKFLLICRTSRTRTACMSCTLSSTSTTRVSKLPSDWLTSCSSRAVGPSCWLAVAGSLLGGMFVAGFESNQTNAYPRQPVNIPHFEILCRLAVALTQFLNLASDGLMAGACVLAHVSHDHNSKHVDFQ
jgi:hypothetical protein